VTDDLIVELIAEIRALREALEADEDGVTDNDCLILDLQRILNVLRSRDAGESCPRGAAEVVRTAGQFIRGAAVLGTTAEGNALVDDLLD